MKSKSGLYKQMQDSNSTTYREFTVNYFEELLKKLSESSLPESNRTFFVTQDQMTMLTGTEEQKEEVKLRWLQREINYRIRRAKECNIDYDLMYLICSKFSQGMYNENSWTITINYLGKDEHDDSYEYLELSFKDDNFYIVKTYSDGYYETKEISRELIDRKDLFQKLIIENNGK